MKMYVSPEDRADTFRVQRALAAEIAGKIMGRSKLRDDEAAFAALILREWSERPLPKTDGRNRPKFCHGTACREYAWRRGVDGMGITDALNVVADDMGVSATAISKAVDKANEDGEVDALIKTYMRK